MTAPARKRLIRDFRKLQNDPPHGVSGAPLTNDIMKWQAVIFGPDDTPWEGGTFQLEMTFNSDYPNKPPSVRFLSKLFHPNVYADGKICLDILQNQWSPIYDISAILTSIQSLLTDPNPNSPANQEAARLYAENRREYNRRVEQCVSDSWATVDEKLASSSSSSSPSSSSPTGAASGMSAPSSSSQSSAQSSSTSSQTPAHTTVLPRTEAQPGRQFMTTDTQSISASQDPSAPSAPSVSTRSISASMAAAGAAPSSSSTPTSLPVAPSAVESNSSSLSTSAAAAPNTADRTSSPSTVSVPLSASHALYTSSSSTSGRPDAEVAIAGSPEHLIGSTDGAQGVGGAVVAVAEGSEERTAAGEQREAFNATGTTTPSTLSSSVGETGGSAAGGSAATAATAATTAAAASS